MNAPFTPTTALATDGWNPRPDPEGTVWNTSAYMCGYTDAFYGEKFGAHDRDQYGAFSAYRPGFNDGLSDQRNAA
jgi:hypothetical protein